ncbi:TlpA disulfide reductase family protein [Lachnospiraceae bacterium 38-14]|jgi:AhpC/TSA family.
MTKQRKYLTVLILSGLCFLTLFSGCSSGIDKTSDNVQENVPAGINHEAGTSNLENLGEFSVQDITGESYTQEMFADYDLTMVNVFTTWCTPCVNEIPDLGKLKNEMESQGVNVAGFVLDAVDGRGNTSEEAIEKARLLAEKTGVTYPFLIPDESYLNGRLSGINAVPETFFVDKEGNIVGETYSGSRSFEDWKIIVETQLKEAVK